MPEIPLGVIMRISPSSIFVIFAFTTDSTLKVNLSSPVS